jgi:hypothetical protein
MIKSIKITNFYSIGATQEISFEISHKDVLDTATVELLGRNINLVNCIIGHNASGKTIVLKAIAFLFWLIGDSYTSMKPDELIPFYPHKLYDKKPTQIELEFFNNGVLFRYMVEFNNQQIKREYLGEKLVRGYSKIFEYTRSANDWDFATSKLTVNKNDLSRFKKRKNVSVLCSLIETGYLPKFSFLKKINTNVINFDRSHRGYFQEFLDTPKSLYTDTNLQKEALAFVEATDVGISGFKFSEMQLVKLGQQVEVAEKKHGLECVHRSKVSEFVLPLLEESNGIKHSLQILSQVAPILKTGGLVVLDEIESGLHPYVVKKIISLFEDRENNPHGAQLIFSTHQHLLLNDRTKTQIFIAEKSNEKFETKIFRLDNVERIRNDENFFQKYLAGAYGGIPSIKWLKK